MCLCFIMVDIGNPLRFWHMLPFVGTMNFPYSILSWDFFVLFVYFLLNIFVVTYLLYKHFFKREYNKSIIIASGINKYSCCNCYSYGYCISLQCNACSPYWNSALLAPRFLTTAFCSGPAILILLFQVLKKNHKI